MNCSKASTCWKCGDAAVDVRSLTHDSEAVTPGALFCCVPGRRADGHDFAADAVDRGAVALLVERPRAAGRRPGGRGDGRAAMAPMAAALNGHPSRSLAVVGVTGTNGKTTTTHLLAPRLRGARLAGRGGRHAGRGPHHAGGARAAGDAGPPARRGEEGRRPRGVVARPGAAPRRRRAVRGGRVHQPQSGPPRLPRHHGGLLRGQGRAVRGGPRRRGPSSTPTTPSGAA